MLEIPFAYKSLHDGESEMQVLGGVDLELAAGEPNGVLYANQRENLSNAEGHYRSTGPEICEQTGGTADAFS
jgi:cysteine synthase A